MLGLVLLDLSWSQLQEKYEVGRVSHKLSFTESIPCFPARGWVPLFPHRKELCRTLAFLSGQL